MCRVGEADQLAPSVRARAHVRARDVSARGAADPVGHAPAGRGRGPPATAAAARQHALLPRPVSHPLTSSISFNEVLQKHDVTNVRACRLRRMGVVTLGHPDSPVVPVLVYTFSKMAATVERLTESNVATVGVGFPATPLNKARIRYVYTLQYTLVLAVVLAAVYSTRAVLQVLPVGVALARAAGALRGGGGARRAGAGPGLLAPGALAARHPLFTRYYLLYSINYFHTFPFVLFLLGTYSLPTQ